MAAGTPQGEASPTLEVRGISKVFGEARVLHDVGFQIEKGEALALLGENGSGKSTLVKVLAGYHTPEPGAELQIGGKELAFPLAPGESRRHGMSFVYQDLGLVPELTVVENLGIGRHLRRVGLRGQYVNWSRERQWARETLSTYGVTLDPSARVGDLSPVNRALLAIVRSLEELRSYREMTGPEDSLLVLDEPTAFLPDHECRHLYELVRRVRSQGTSVIFVSHDLDSVRAVSERAIVLRDGRLVADVDVTRTTDDELVAVIVGHPLRSAAQLRAERAPDPSATRSYEDGSAAPILVAEGLRGGLVNDLSFELHAGEIMGMTGLLGSGAEDVPYLLTGSLGREPRGQSHIAGTLHTARRTVPASGQSPRRARKMGIALVPADRLREGLGGRLTVGENLLLLVVGDYYRRARLNKRELRRSAFDRCKTFDVRPLNPDVLVDQLSGGNQQKVLLAKWLEIRPNVLVLHEPTQGVDVGVREEIYALIRATVATGTAVVWVTTDLPELVRVCDRVLVMAAGRVVDVRARDRLSKEALSAAAYSARRSSARDLPGAET